MSRQRYERTTQLNPREWGLRDLAAWLALPFSPLIIAVVVFAWAHALVATVAATVGLLVTIGLVLWHW